MHTLEKKSKLVCNPFVGEFGHQLFSWQGVIRERAKFYDEVTIFCEKGFEFLYQDITKNIIPLYVPPGETNMWQRTGYTFDKGIYTKYGITDFVDYDILDAKYCATVSITEQLFIKYTCSLKTCNDVFPILIHARNTAKHNTGYRNWSIEFWQEFISFFSDYGVASIGSKAGAHHINNTIDLREIPLNLLCSYMSTAKVVVGPSSGPMHFASLCWTPHVVWSAKNAVALIDNRMRYEKVWNPLNTPVHVIDHEGWQPSVNTVVKAVKQFMRG